MENNLKKLKMTQIFQMPSKIRLYYFLIGMIVFSGSYYFGSEITMSVIDAQLLFDEFEFQVIDIDALSITTHNLLLALVMFVPGFGVIFGGISGFETGVVITAMKTIYPELQDFSVLALLLVTPFGILELISYGIAISRSGMILRHINSKINLQLMIRPVIIEVIIVLVLLFVGGQMEYLMINFIGVDYIVGSENKI